MSKAVLCHECLTRARARHAEAVFVYQNGHMLRYGGDLPTLHEWPLRSAVETFCGQDVYGMGGSTLYQMPWADGKPTA